MTSLTSFFVSLLPGDNTIPNDDCSNNRSILIALMAKHSTTTTMVYHYIGTHSLQEYITRLCTPDCFVPLHLLPQTRPCLTITSYLHVHTPVLMMSACRCRGNKPHQQMFQLASLPPNVMHHVVYSLLTHVLPAQLDHPPDHFKPTHMFLAPLTYWHGSYQPTQQYPAMDHQHGNLLSFKVPTIPPLLKTSPHIHPVCCTHDTDTLLACIPPAPHEFGKHDLKPP